jgi:hypothetical protein
LIFPSPIVQQRKPSPKLRFSMRLGAGNSVSEIPAPAKELRRTIRSPVWNEPIEYVAQKRNSGKYVKRFKG